MTDKHWSGTHPLHCHANYYDMMGTKFRFQLRRDDGRVFDEPQDMDFQAANWQPRERLEGLYLVLDVAERLLVEHGLDAKELERTVEKLFGREAVLEIYEMQARRSVRQDQGRDFCLPDPDPDPDQEPSE